MVKKDNCTVCKVKYQAGNTNCKVAFVLSCPGKDEFIKKRPCAGKTGDNLQILINDLHIKLPKIFLFPQKEDYLITNASNIVHYKALTGDTEPQISEILSPANISRLKRELKNAEIIICMGEKAEVVIKAIFGNSKKCIYKCLHVSFQALNRRYASRELSGETSQERKVERLLKVGDELCSQIKDAI